MYAYMFVTARALAVLHLFDTSLAVNRNRMVDQSRDDRIGITQGSNSRFRSTTVARKLFPTTKSSRNASGRRIAFCLELNARAPVIQDSCECGWQICKKNETCDARTSHCAPATRYIGVTIAIGLFLLFLLLVLPVGLEISRHCKNKDKSKDKNKTESRRESKSHNDEDTDDEADSDDDGATRDEPPDPEEIAILLGSFSAHKVNKMEKSLSSFSLGGNPEDDSPIKLRKVKKSSHRGTLTVSGDDVESVNGEYREKKRRKKKKKKSPWATGNFVDANGDAEFNDYRTVHFTRHKPPPRRIVFTGCGILKSSDNASSAQKKKKVHWTKNMETPDRPLPPPPYYIPALPKAVNNGGDATALLSPKGDKPHREKKPHSNLSPRKSNQHEKKNEHGKNPADEKKTEPRTGDRKTPELAERAAKTEKKDAQMPRQLRTGTGAPLTFNIPPI